MKCNCSHVLDVLEGMPQAMKNHYLNVPKASSFSALGFDSSPEHVLKEHTRGRLAYVANALNDQPPNSWVPSRDSYGSPSRDLHPQWKERQTEWAKGYKAKHGLPDDMDNYDVERHWNGRVHKALGRGETNYDDAKEAGYTPPDGDVRESGRDSWSGQPDGTGWQKLPRNLYHTSTNANAVASSGGLKTREELSQGTKGGGLGGGQDNTISLTTDPDLAHSIYQSLHEYHAAVTGRKTVDHFLDEAKNPKEGKPFTDSLKGGFLGGDEHFDHLRNKTTDSYLHRPKDSPESGTSEDELTGGWKPHPADKGFDTGEGKPKRHVRWVRPATDEEQTNRMSEFYKHFSNSRQFNGGARNPLFVANDPQALASTNPEHFGILHMHPTEKGQGYPLSGTGKHHEGADSGEWRTSTGEALQPPHHIDKPPVERVPGVGLQAPRTAMRYHADVLPPKPEYVPLPDDATPDESNAHFERNRQDRKKWTHHVREQLSTGRVSNEAAQGAGYYGDGSEQQQNSHDLNWQPLPSTLYHTTTNGPAVRQHGLKTRDELRQQSGMGLGGGSSDAISFTTDRELAHHIHDQLHEFHDVVNDRKTPQDLWDAAKRGDDTDGKPFHHHLVKFWKNDYKDGDPLPQGLQDTLSGTHRKHDIMGSTHEQFEKEHGPGWKPNEDRGWDSPSGRRYGEFTRPMNEDEKRENGAEFYKRYSAYREHSGGPPDSMFFGSDTKGFAQSNPKNFEVHRYKPVPGGQGFPMGGMKEWRTGSGKAVQFDGVDSRPDNMHRTAVWRPNERMFAPGKQELDPRLFDKEEHLKPEVRQDILSRIDSVWGKKYGDWQSWARVYLAGSEASYWWQNNDLDTLIGIHYPDFKKLNPEFQHMNPQEISDILNAEFRKTINDEDNHPEWDPESTWHTTFFTNPGSYDIRNIKPYAAYDISGNQWIVRPPDAKEDWGPDKFPHEDWKYVDDAVRTAQQILSLPEPSRGIMAQQYWEFLHTDRKRGFGPYGSGYTDRANVVFKALDMHPAGLLKGLLKARKSAPINRKMA